MSDRKDVWSGTENELRQSLLKDAKVGTALDFHCLHCGAHICVAESRLKGLLITQIHMERDHGMTDQVTVLREGEGGDYIVGPAPYRCDLCLTVVEKPWWVYTTGPGMPADDPEWLVCDPCHILVGLRSLPALLKRSVTLQSESQKISPDEALRLAPKLGAVIQNFLDNIVGEPVRDET